jgi:hypothetical protein
MAVDDQELAAHHALLQASMERELERRAAAARRPGQGLTLDSQVRPLQQGLYFGQGFKPPAHVAPVAPPGDPLVGGVLAAGAQVAAPGSRRPAVSQLVTTTSAPVAHNRTGPQVEYVDVGPRRGLLGRIIDRLRGGAR